MKTKISIYLASASPRRRQLLAQAGLKFKIIKPAVKEIQGGEEKPSDFVLRLSKEKALAGLNKIKSKTPLLLIAADTIVVSKQDGLVLGKPKTKRDAARMLRKIQGKQHTVYTGYTILFASGGIVKKIVSNTVRTDVTIRTLNSIQIKRYLFAGESYDKAGAYAAQGVGAALIKELRGSYSNVVGLPLCEVLTDLDHFFGVPYLKKY